MKFKIALLAIFISLASMADAPNITTKTFNQIIQPSIKKMVEDFYILLIKIDPLNKDVIELRDNISDLKTNWIKYTEKCKFIDNVCKEGLSALKQELLRGNKLLLKIENSFQLNSKNNKKFSDSRILLSKTLNSISDEFHAVLRSLDFFKYDRKEFYEVTDRLKNIKLSLNILITGFLSDEYQDNFYFIYSNFFKKLEGDIIEKSNLKLFSRELESLNISWNNFNMKVSKWKTSLSPDTLALIESMHKRWNSILKIIWAQ